MAQAKIAISMPEEVLNEIDELANKNFSNRSHTIVRVWLEWKALQAHQAKKTDPNSEAPTDPNLKLALAA